MESRAVAITNLRLCGQSFDDGVSRSPIVGNIHRACDLSSGSNTTKSMHIFLTGKGGRVYGRLVTTTYDHDRDLAEGSFLEVLSDGTIETGKYFQNFVSHWNNGEDDLRALIISLAPSPASIR